MNVGKLKKDFVWYSVGAAIPMILGFIKTPIFTRYYSPLDYGNFALINTTYSYINLFAFAWLLNCVWRYYIHSKNNNELNNFFTNIVAFFFIGLMITTIITLIWIIFTNYTITRKLIIANYINFITVSISGIYFIIIRLDGKSLAYNLYTIISSVLSFIILFILTFLFKNSIDAMLNCSNIVNILLSILIIYKLNKNYHISKKYVSKILMKEFLVYGFSTVFFNLSLLLLISGDRYIIKIFYSTDKVGIYNQIYNLSQISIVAFIKIFFNIINPYQFKLFEEDVNNENGFYNYIILYILCILPITIYFSIFSRQISNLLLGEKFRSGYDMMPYIMITCFIYGLSTEHETRLKFKNNLKPILVNIITAGIINILLNFIFIPIKGYKIAALTTLISYIYLYIMDVKADIQNVDSIKNFEKSKIKIIKSIFSILIIQIIIHFMINKIYTHYSISFAIIEGIVFMITLYGYIYYKYDDLFKKKILI